MTLWIILAVMTAAAALSVLVPMARAAGRAAQAEGNDVAVYRDQLAEIDRDVERGLIGAGEAEAARTEIARRLLKASRGAEASTAPALGRVRGRAATAIAVLVLPAVALLVYQRLGKPELPDQPLAARLAAAPERQSIDAMVARVEAHLAQKPEDGQGWDVLAPVYMSLERPADAAHAYQQAIRLLGSSPRREFALGQALTSAAGGLVTAEARAAFEKAAAGDPTQPGPRMYLAVALSQDGRHADAAAIWRKVVAEARGGEAWLDAARRELAAAERAAGPAAAQPTPSQAAPTPSAPRPGATVPAAPAGAAGAPGPSSDDMAAAATLAPEDRTKLIEGMVARLSERLRSSGGSVEEWSRLIRSLAVLGRTEDARGAARDAMRAFEASEADRARIGEVAAGLGLVL